MNNSEIMVDGQFANKVLDIRVQRGGLTTAESLIKYGEKYNIQVVIKSLENDSCTA